MADAFASSARSVPKAVAWAVSRGAVVSFPPLNARAYAGLGTVAVATAVVGTSTRLAVFASIAAVAGAALGVVDGARTVA